MLAGNIQELLRWGWLIVAVLFFVVEVFTPGLVLLCFGIGALGGALAAFLGVGLEWQFVVFIGISAASVMLARPFADRISRPDVQQIAGNRMIGKRAIVLQAIDLMANTGMVRVETEEWRAESIDGKVLAAGEIVEVLAVDGVRLQVQAATDTTAENE